MEHLHSPFNSCALIDKCAPNWAGKRSDEAAPILITCWAFEKEIRAHIFKQGDESPIPETSPPETRNSSCVETLDAVSRHHEASRDLDENGGHARHRTKVRSDPSAKKRKRSKYDTKQTCTQLGR